eukprot:616389-Pyramimonas_sp.AAC.1
MVRAISLGPGWGRRPSPPARGVRAGPSVPPYPADAVHVGAGGAQVSLRPSPWLNYSASLACRRASRSLSLRPAQL